MELLGVGPAELLFIILIALIVIGPKDMGKVARSAGRFLNRMYRSEAWKTLTQASSELRTLPNRLAREAAMEELQEVRQELEGAGEELQSGARQVRRGLEAWTPKDPPSVPTKGDSSPEADPSDPSPEG